MEQKLNIDEKLVERCRTAAKRISDGVQSHIEQSTTVSVERTIARLLGVDGVDAGGVPLPNILVEQLAAAGGLADGISRSLGNAVAATGMPPREVAGAAGRGEFLLSDFPDLGGRRAEEVLEPWISEGMGRLDEVRETRERLQTERTPGEKPWLYVIVATGNIYEDVLQAKSAALQGADIIAVIRTTAQSLLDYVPYGPTTEGFGGTYATQENFRIMRKALDQASEETGRYIQLVNYCSGLCMPEIAAMGAMERLDMMLNDAIYGILFRDINMERTFIDQYFSRMINAYSGIIINTGEDNYLTTADAVEEAHTVLASQFINEALAERSGMPRKLMGLGHAFEINPDIRDSFLMEIAQAQMIRQIFPEAPIKYMPPTKYMTGDIFRGQLMDGMFNLAGVMTGQSIQLLGMLTEAVHTPFLHDRALSIANAKHVFNSARSLGDEIQFAPDGRIQKRADSVLTETVVMLEDIAETGLMSALEGGVFAAVKRPREGGKGVSGVAVKSGRYLNPFMKIFKERLGIA